MRRPMITDALTAADLMGRRSDLMKARALGVHAAIEWARHEAPDLFAELRAARSVGRALSAEDLAELKKKVYTVYIGCIYFLYNITVRYNSVLEEMLMIISAMNLKGGVGKTTTAMSLATAAEREGKDVEVYDCDPQSSAQLWRFADQNDDSLPSFPCRRRTWRRCGVLASSTARTQTSGSLSIAAQRQHHGRGGRGIGFCRDSDGSRGGRCREDNQRRSHAHHARRFSTACSSRRSLPTPFRSRRPKAKSKTTT